MTPVVRDGFGILHMAYVIHPIQGRSVAVARCQWWIGMEAPVWDMNDASDGETNCMACVAAEVL